MFGESILVLAIVFLFHFSLLSLLLWLFLLFWRRFSDNRKIYDNRQNSYCSVGPNNSMTYYTSNNIRRGHSNEALYYLSSASLKHREGRREAIFRHDTISLNRNHAHVADPDTLQGGRSCGGSSRSATGRNSIFFSVSYAYFFFLGGGQSL